MGVVNMDRWLGLLMILAWVVIWVSFVFDYLDLCLCLVSVSFFSFSFFFFRFCCCDLGLSFWLLDLFSWLLGLIREEHEEQVVMFLVAGFFFIIIIFN